MLLNGENNNPVPNVIVTKFKEALNNEILTYCLISQKIKGEL